MWTDKMICCDSLYYKVIDVKNWLWHVNMFVKLGGLFKLEWSFGAVLDLAEGAKEV